MTYLIQRLFFFFVLLTSLPSPLDARWATPDEAIASLELSNQEIIIHENGTWEQSVEEQTKILKDAGRDVYGNAQLFFTKDSEKLEIIEAKTIINGQTYKVPKESIEIQPLASSTQGFDQAMQVLIAYPKVEIGASLYIKYKRTVFNVPLKGFHASQWIFQRSLLAPKSILRVRSKLPLFTITNDPKDAIALKKRRDGKMYTYTMTQKKPIFDQIVDESYQAFDENDFTWIKLSTLNNTEAFGKALVEDYEKIIGQPLPLAYAAIKERASTQKSDVDVINSVTLNLSKILRYMGDWKTNKGRLAPRDLAQTAADGIGDCKDYATTTAAILRQLGLDTSIALVMRGEPYIDPTKNLPSFGNYNHAIVKVVGAKGKIYWVDPTNRVSMADGIFPDIADRSTLVLNKKQVIVEKIPPVNPEHSSLTIHESITFDAHNAVTVAGKAILSGESSIGHTGLALDYSPKLIQDIILGSISEGKNLEEKKLSYSGLDSRVVDQVSFDYSYLDRNKTIFTNMGRGIPLSYDQLKLFFDASPTDVGGLYLEQPVTKKRQISIKGKDIPMLDILHYNCKTPWIIIDRTASKQKDGIEITDTMTILKSFISSKEMKTKAFLDFQSDMKRYFKNVVLIAP